jgi:hypothetical protein
MMKVRRVGENSEVYILLFLRTAPRRKGLVSGVCLILKFIVPKLSSEGRHLQRRKNER